MLLTPFRLPPAVSCLPACPQVTKKVTSPLPTTDNIFYAGTGMLLCRSEEKVRGRAGGVVWGGEQGLPWPWPGPSSACPPHCFGWIDPATDWLACPSVSLHPASHLPGWTLLCKPVPPLVIPAGGAV